MEECDEICKEIFPNLEIDSFWEMVKILLSIKMEKSVYFIPNLRIWFQFGKKGC